MPSRARVYARTSLQRAPVTHFVSVVTSLTSLLVKISVKLHLERRLQLGGGRSARVQWIAQQVLCPSRSPRTLRYVQPGVGGLSVSPLSDSRT